MWMYLFSVGNDINLYLVNFEGTCIVVQDSKKQFGCKDLILLPNKAPDTRHQRVHKQLLKILTKTKNKARVSAIHLHVTGKSDGAAVKVPKDRKVTATVTAKSNAVAILALNKMLR